MFYVYKGKNKTCIKDDEKIYVTPELGLIYAPETMLPFRGSVKIKLLKISLKLIKITDL